MIWDKRFSLKWLVFIWGVLSLISCGAQSSLHSTEQAQNALRKDSLNSPMGETEYEFKLRRLINDYRLDNGLTTVDYDPHLHLLAREHSKNMGRFNALSHNGFNERFKKSGYHLAVENVAYNYPNPETQFEGWRHSSGHNRNMLHPGISHAGISKVGNYVTFFACGK